MSSKVWLLKPHQTGKELELFTDVLESNWLTTKGKYLDLFETELKKYLQTEKHLIALNSGTSSIHMALMELGVGQGDIVLCQTFSFCATVNPVLYLGANPIFIDSEKDTWNMSPQYLRKAILYCLKLNKKPKAIIVVDIYGMPAKWDQLKKISNEYEIPIIEDAAAAFGSSFKGVKCGLFGDLGVFSFNGNKIITTSTGGALIVNKNKKELILKASQNNIGKNDYIHDNLGFNYRMSNLLASIGLAQLEEINDRVNKKRAIFKLYKKEISLLSDVVSFHSEINENYKSNYWLTCILLNGKINLPVLLEEFEKNNNKIRKKLKALHTQ